MTYKFANAIRKYYPGVPIISYWKSVLCILLILLLPYPGFAIKEDELAEEEISVILDVKGLGSIEIPAVVHDKDVYLSISGVFDFLKIRNSTSPAFDSISGFYVNQQDVFLIDKKHDKIYFKDKVFDLKPTDLIRSESNLYLNLTYFKTVFDLDGTFIFRRLLVTLSSSVELPAIRETRLEQMRKNISRLKGEVIADTTLKRSYPLFHLGAADWSVISTQQDLGNTDTRLNLGLGSLLAGGEANASLNYYTSQVFSEKQQYYQWHFVNNDNALLRQVSAGKIYTQSIASLYAPLVGVQINNTPTIQRRSYGTYTLSNVTDPGWIVELYVNDVLVDYQKADASGLYSFDVPLIYGYSIIKLRFYGPYGEERTAMQYISVPFNFLPAKEFEYAATAGIIEDGQSSRFSRIATNYGLTKHITIGGGVEYLSSIATGAFIPFVNTSFRLASHLLLSGDYAYNVKSHGVLSYRLPSNLQFDLDYTRYQKGQTAIYYNYLEERKATVTMPMRTLGSSIFSKLSVDQIILPYSKFTNMELAFSGSTHGLGMNFTTYASFTPNVSPYTYSILSLSFLVLKHYFLTSQLQYDYRQSRPDFMKFTVEKHLFGKGFLNMSYQQYFNSDNRNFLLGLRYDFSFSRVSVSALTGTNNTYSRVESASGSFLFDGKTNYINVNNRSNVGKGGIVVIPYLDLNCNGKRDPDEPAAPGLKIHVNGGRTEYNLKDTTVRVFELEPYVSYYVELDRNSFDIISWQLTKRVIKVVVTPNDFTKVEVPVEVQGEVSGLVSIKDNKRPKGQGQMIICVYNTDTNIIARAVTEADGFFNYLGLAPGSYLVGLDTGQLHKLHMTASPSFVPINILKTRDGDVADNLEFALHSTGVDISKRQEPMAMADSSEKKNYKDSLTTGKRLVHTDEPEQKPIAKDKMDIAAPAMRNSTSDTLRQQDASKDTAANVEYINLTIRSKHKVKNFNNDQAHAIDSANARVLHNLNRKAVPNKEDPEDAVIPNQKPGIKPQSVWETLAKFFFVDIIEFIANLFK